MKKYILLIMILAISLVNIRPLKAQDDWKLEKADINIGGQTTNADKDSAKFEEYREVPDGTIVPKFRISLENKKGNYYLDMRGKNVSRDDENYLFRFGRYGCYDLEFEWNEIPHNFSKDGRTIFTRQSEGVYTISDEIQRTLQTGVIPIDNFLSDAKLIDLELKREKARGSFRYTPILPLNIKLDFSYEKRDGGRPIGSTFGEGNITELPEPIKYRTTDLGLSAEYAKDLWLLKLEYKLSLFQNEIDTLTWDNPYRLIDLTVPEAQDFSYEAGSSRGRMGLPPDNTAHTVSLTGMWKALKATRIFGTVSYSLWKQDEDFIPYTINSVISTPQLPRNSLDAEMKNLLLNFGINSRVTKDFSINAKFRYYDMNNDTPILEFPGQVFYDAVWEDGGRKNLPIDRTEKQGSIELTYNLPMRSSATFGYTREDVDRDYEEAHRTTEDKYKFSIDSHLTDSAMCRLSYEHSRRGSDYNSNIPAILGHVPSGTSDNPPGLRKYFEAARNRDEVKLFLDFDPTDSLSISTSYLYGNDDYNGSMYGLHNDTNHAASLDLNYSPNDKLSLYGFYSFEDHDAEQWAMEHNTRSPSLDPGDNWRANTEDKVNTIGAGIQASLIPDKLNFDSSYSYSRARAKISLYSPPGGTGKHTKNDPALDFPEPDNTDLHILQCRFNYLLRKNVNVTLGYWFERYNLDDYAKENLNLSMPGALLLGAFNDDYKYHVGYLMVSFKW
jgi:MtrB/PioB family decaheme-associated outer membrane protein